MGNINYALVHFQGRLRFDKVKATMKYSSKYQMLNIHANE